MKQYGLTSALSKSIYCACTMKHSICAEATSLDRTNKPNKAHLGVLVWLELRGVRPTCRANPQTRLADLS